MMPEPTRGGDLHPGRTGVQVLLEDVDHVLPGLPVGRNSDVPLYRSLSRVVGGEDAAEIPLEPVAQQFQVADPASDILDRIEDIAHLEAVRRRRHQLHQPVDVGVTKFAEPVTAKRSNPDST